MPPTENSDALFGWHSQDSRATGPLDTDAAYIRGYNAGMQFIVNEAKKAPTINPEALCLVSRWKNAKTEPPPPNTDVEVYCKALGVTVGYHRPLTDDHRTLRNVTHWRPIPLPPLEAEP